MLLLDGICLLVSKSPPDEKSLRAVFSHDYTYEMTVGGSGYDILRGTYTLRNERNVAFRWDVHVQRVLNAVKQFTDADLCWNPELEDFDPEMYRRHWLEDTDAIADTGWQVMDDLASCSRWAKTDINNADDWNQLSRAEWGNSSLELEDNLLLIPLRPKLRASETSDASDGHVSGGRGECARERSLLGTEMTGFALRDVGYGSTCVDVQPLDGIDHMLSMFGSIVHV